MLYKFVNKLINILHVVLTFSNVPPVWHDCTSLLVQQHHTVLGKRRTNRLAIGSV